MQEIIPVIICHTKYTRTAAHHRLFANGVETVDVDSEKHECRLIYASSMHKTPIIRGVKSTFHYADFLRNFFAKNFR